MKQFYVALLIFLSISVAAQELEQEKETKIKFKVGGRVDTYLFSDTYKGIEFGTGIQYLIPARPEIDAFGNDLSAEGQMRFGIASSRLNVLGNYDFSPDFKASSFVEIDFMGVAMINLPRLRHAFLALDWKDDRLVIGQTSHLFQVDEVSPPTVLFGSGYPYAPLARPVQVQYTRKFGTMFRLSGALSMFYGQEGAMQNRSFTPDLSARLVVGSAADWMVGVAAGFKSIAPGLEVVQDQYARLNAFSGAVFGLVRPTDKLAIRSYLFLGQDPQTFGLSGMFAPILGGLGYTPSVTGSGYLDFEVKLPRGFSAGILGGYQQNFGTWDPIISSQVWTALGDEGLSSFFRIAPRVWYSYKGKLDFGFEYLYNQALWAESFNHYYLPESFLPAAVNHRVMLLARFNF